jgi:hypothetical protein
LLTNDKATYFDKVQIPGSRFPFSFRSFSLPSKEALSLGMVGGGGEGLVDGA